MLVSSFFPPLFSPTEENDELRTDSSPSCRRRRWISEVIDWESFSHPIEMGFVSHCLLHVGEIERQVQYPRGCFPVWGLSAFSEREYGISQIMHSLCFVEQGLIIGSSGPGRVVRYRRRGRRRPPAWQIII